MSSSRLASNTCSLNRLSRRDTSTIVLRHAPHSSTLRAGFIPAARKTGSVCFVRSVTRRAARSAVARAVSASSLLANRAPNHTVSSTSIVNAPRSDSLSNSALSASRATELSFMTRSSNRTSVKGPGSEAVSAARCSRVAKTEVPHGCRSWCSDAVCALRRSRVSVSFLSRSAFSGFELRSAEMMSETSCFFTSLMRSRPSTTKLRTPASSSRVARSSNASELCAT